MPPTAIAPRGNRKLPGDNLGEGGFADAVPPGNKGGFAVLNRQRDAAHHGDVSVSAGYIANVQQGLAGHFVPPL